MACEFQGTRTPASCHCCLHHLPPATGVSHMSFSHSLDSHTLSSAACPLPNLHAPLLPPTQQNWLQGVSQHWFGCPGCLEQAEGHMARYQGGTGKSCGVAPADHACISHETETPMTAYDSAAFSPFHLPPLPAQQAWESHDVETTLALVRPLPPSPNCLEVSALCQTEICTHDFFVLVFSSFHCDTRNEEA